ncbi:hypothetical protein IWX75_003430 [Arthrobacter sp. CAN_A6]|uniref:hypothetical protein n=1 Tax=Arthrobacter sp. CAN_A6 TaxID=2787721 RepID=UPI0018C9FC2F
MRLSDETQNSMRLLREALNETTGIEEIDRMAQSSILMGVVGDDENLLQVFEEETGPEQVELDLHLEGAGVEGHSTNALAFATFVSRVAEAVKETAKDIANFPRYNAGLLIEGASPGSVRVVLKAPTPPTTQDLTPKTSVSSVDSEALRRIARVMTLASEPEGETLDDEPLNAAIHQLPIKARTKLKSAAEQAIKTSWEIDGSIRQRQFGRDRVELSARGANRLRSALLSAHEEFTTEEAIGTVDGLKHSLGVMWFRPEVASRSFQATVADDAMLSRIAELAADPDQRVLAIFDTYSSLVGLGESVVKKSRLLRSITLVSAHKQGELPM